jgi:transcriptional regulator with XRE-family HTH domain
LPICILHINLPNGNIDLVMPMTVVGERLQAARKKAGFSNRAELARLSGISLDSIGRYERGEREPRATEIDVLSRVLDVSSDYLLGKTSDPTPFEKKIIIEGGKEPSTHPLSDGSKDPLQHPNGGRILGQESLTWVPVISPIVKVSAGTGNLCADVEWERIDDFPLFDGEIAALYSNNGLLSMYVEGDSMEPQVHDGDLVVFKKTTEWVSGNVMVVCLDGRLLVKGVVRGPKGDTILRSTNKNYRDIEIGEESFFLVYGRVLRIIRHWEPKSVL